MPIVSRIRSARKARGLAVALAVVLGSAAGVAGLFENDASAAHAASIDPSQLQPPVPNEPSQDATSKVRLDRSGRKQVGIASFYADRYSGKTMADGTPMQLYSNNAASLTLPLGSTAKVTNLETGKSAVVTIRDRGPYVKGRIVDLSPATARLIGMSKKQGVARVEVAPLSLPESRVGSKLTAANNR